MEERKRERKIFLKNFFFNFKTVPRAEEKFDHGFSWEGQSTACCRQDRPVQQHSSGGSHQTGKAFA